MIKQNEIYIQILGKGQAEPAAGTAAPATAAAPAVAH
jgi:hypothetical protein